MGDIAFNIFKDVNLNKQVTLDINKDVFVNVENPDQLATAEADAEAFGPFALAEVDAYTVVTPPQVIPGDPETIFNTGQIQLEGGIPTFHGADPGDPLSIIFNQPVSPGVDGDIPDLDDLNAIGAFADLDGIPPGDGTNDTGLPQPNLTISNLDLTASADVADPAGGDLWEYTNDNDLLIDFGSRNVERNGIAGFQPGETGNLSLTVPAGDTFDVLFTVTDGIEIDFADTNAFFTFVPDGGAELPSNNETVIAPADVDLIADSVGELAGYEIQGIADIPWHIPGQDIVDGGTAFAYAESTSALDLSQMMGPMAM